MAAAVTAHRCRSPGHRLPPGRRIELPRRGTHLRPRGRRARPARRPCSSCTAGSRAAASTGSRPSSRSREHFRVDRPRPPRPRPRPAHPPRLPARRLRRRLRGDARRARHRPGDRGRLLDGRPGRAAAVAPPPRPRRRASCSARPRAGFMPNRARASRTSRGCSLRSSAARVAALAPPLPSVPDAPAPAADACPTWTAAETAPPRLAHDRRGRPLDQHVPRRPLDRRGRRARPRSCARPRTAACGPTYSSRSPTPSPAPPSTASTTGTSPARSPTSRRRCSRRLPRRRRPHRCESAASADSRPTSAYQRGRFACAQRARHPAAHDAAAARRDRAARAGCAR